MSKMSVKICYWGGGGGGRDRSLAKFSSSSLIWALKAGLYVWSCFGKKSTVKCFGTGFDLLQQSILVHLLIEVVVRLTTQYPTQCWNNFAPSNHWHHWSMFYSNLNYFKGLSCILYLFLSCLECLFSHPPHSSISVFIQCKYHSFLGIISQMQSQGRRTVTSSYLCIHFKCLSLYLTQFMFQHSICFQHQIYFSLLSFANHGKALDPFPILFKVNSRWKEGPFVRIDFIPEKQDLHSTCKRRPRGPLSWCNWE